MHVLGWYTAHMLRKQRKTKYASPEESLLARLPVGDPADCWLWPLAKTKRGYGLLRHNKRAYYTHRVAYLAFKGPVPADLDVCHTCDNPACCNPDHLWLGTAADNAKDMMNKGRGRQTCLRGEASPRAILSEERALAILKLALSGMNQQAIARQFGVSQSCVMLIKTRRNWKHLVP